MKFFTRGLQIQLNKFGICQEGREVCLQYLIQKLVDGTGMVQFNAIRDILDRERIKYKYKTYNHLGEWAGTGTLRGNFGSVGNPAAQSIQYEIFVARKDLDKAKAVMWNSPR